MKYLIPLYTMIAGRFHGGAFYWLDKVIPAMELRILFSRQVRNALYAAPYALAGNHWLPFLFAFVGIDLGHYQFWFMAMQKPSPRTGAIEFVMRPLLKIMSYGCLTYCTIGLMIKGAFIAAGTLDWHVIALHAIWWPTAYWIGMRSFNLRNDIAEALSGLFGGAALLLILK